MNNLIEMDASLKELTLSEQQAVEGGTALSYWAGFAVGATLGIGVIFVASVVVTMNLMNNQMSSGEQWA
jgi:hypothetical protein